MEPKSSHWKAINQHWLRFLEKNPGYKIDIGRTARAGLGSTWQKGEPLKPSNDFVVVRPGPDHELTKLDVPSRFILEIGTPEKTIGTSAQAGASKPIPVPVYREEPSDLVPPSRKEIRQVSARKI